MKNIKKGEKKFEFTFVDLTQINKISIKSHIDIYL